MKRNHAIFLSLALLFSFAFISNIVSEDVPSDADMAAYLEGGGDAGVPADPAAVPADAAAAPDMGGAPAAPDMGGAPAEGADPMAGMDGGMGSDAGGSADVLFPDDASGGTAPDMGGEAGGALPGEGGMDLPGMGGEAAITAPGEGPETGINQLPGGAPEMPGETKPAPKKKTPARTDKSVTKTDDIYTKSSYIGGYRNMKDFMTWDVKATSKLSSEHGAGALNDNIVDTAWIEAKKDGGKKQVITFDFAEKHFIGLYEKKYHKAKIGQIRILNGFATDKSKWKYYYRAKKLKVSKNKTTLFYIMLRDTMNWQTITMKKPVIISPGDAVKAEIMEVYPDMRRDDDSYVAITEIALIGEPYGAKKEPKYIPEHLQGME